MGQKEENKGRGRRWRRRKANRKKREKKRKCVWEKNEEKEKEKKEAPFTFTRIASWSPHSLLSLPFLFVWPPRVCTLLLMRKCSSPLAAPSCSCSCCYSSSSCYSWSRARSKVHTVCCSLLARRSRLVLFLSTQRQGTHKVHRKRNMSSRMHLLSSPLLPSALSIRLHLAPHGPPFRLEGVAGFP